MTKLYLLLGLFSAGAFAASPFIVSNLIDNGLTASQAVVTDASKQLASVARGNLTDVGTDGITVTSGASSVFGSGTSLSQHVADSTHNGYLSSTDWSTFNGKQATISIGAFSAAPSAPGLTLSGAAINMDPADATHPGGVSTTTQTLAGAKTFSSAPTFSTMTLGSILLAGAGGLLSQDNANFFWDATNHRLGLGTTSPNSLIDIKSSSNDNAHGIRFSPASGAEYYTLFMSSASALTLTNPNQGVTLWQVNNQGRTVFAGAGFGHPDAEVLLQNGSGHTGIPSFAIKKLTSQTADFATFYDTDEVTKLFTVTIAGKAVASNIQDAAFSSAGVVTNDASGNLASVVPGTSGNVLTSNGSAWVSSAAAGGGGGVCTPLVKTADYTILSGDFTSCSILEVRMNCSAACTLTLVAAAGGGRVVKVKNVAAQQVTVSGTIDGDTAYIMPLQYQSAEFDDIGGSEWSIF